MRLCSRQVAGRASAARGLGGRIVGTAGGGVQGRLSGSSAGRPADRPSGNGRPAGRGVSSAGRRASASPADRPKPHRLFHTSINRPRCEVAGAWRSGASASTPAAELHSRRRPAVEAVPQATGGYCLVYAAGAAAEDLLFGTRREAVCRVGPLQGQLRASGPRIMLSDDWRDAGGLTSTNWSNRRAERGMAAKGRACRQVDRRALSSLPPREPLELITSGRCPTGA